MSGAISGVLKKGSQFLGLSAPKAQKVKLPSGANFAGLTTPGLSLLGNEQGQFELSRTGFDPAAFEEQLRSGLSSSLAGVGGLRSGLAPLRGGFASLAGQFPGLREGSQALGGQVQGLLGQVQPGFGRLTESLVRGVRDREQASVGNLRSALAKRNVLGSSFAQRELQRTGLDFAQEEERVRSGAFQAELAASRGLIEDAGNLLELEGSQILQEASLLGQELGFTEFEANLFAQEISVMAEQRALLAQTVTRQLEELGISGNITNQVQAIVGNIFSQNAQFAAGAALEERQNFAGLAGTIGGGLFSGVLCWVAREVYGADNPKWLQFRHWMLTQAPRWLRQIYIRHGEKFAGWLKSHPVWKPAIRCWMDSKIGVSHG